VLEELLLLLAASVITAADNDALRWAVILRHWRKSEARIRSVTANSALTGMMVSTARKASRHSRVPNWIRRSS
jgi:hypothetical protein